MKLRILIFLSLFALTLHQSHAQLLAEVEAGGAFTGKNEIRVPGDGGTTFDSKDFGSALRFAYRVRVGYRFNDRHNVFITAAPLKLKYEGDFANTVNFNGESFGPNNSTINYVFNSYRLTYRYDFIRLDRLRIGAGLTAKLRDAKIEVVQGNQNSTKGNSGFVPLINVMIDYQFNDTFGLLLEGDGLASGQGRAFDFQLSVPIKFDDHLGVKLGYRVLEGGVDNDEVYNMSWINYINAGVFYNFY